LVATALSKLQKIERRAFGRQQGPRQAAHLEHHLAGFAALAVFHMPDQLGLRIQLPHRGLDPGAAANHGAFARHHLRPRLAGRIDQAGRQVARAHVLRERARRVCRASAATAAAVKSNDFFISNLRKKPHAYRALNY
jgi:hypothetical protein